LACVYQHIRKDSNIPFYIGIGKTTKRSSSLKNRNKWWHHVANKVGYSIEILFDNISWEEAKKKEIELISLHKRKCEGGILVNLTLGGDGSLGFIPSETTRRKMSDSHHRKLTHADILKIRELYASGNHSHRSLAKDYGVSKYSVTGIVTNKTYTHLR